MMKVTSSSGMTVFVACKYIATIEDSGEGAFIRMSSGDIIAIDEKAEAFYKRMMGYK